MPSRDRRRERRRLRPPRARRQHASAPASSRATTWSCGPRETASNGEIVVALIEDEATVKRYFKERNGVRLQAENPDYEPIRSKDAKVLGKVVGVFRKV